MPTGAPMNGGLVMASDLVKTVRATPTCPRCNRDLEARVEMKQNGRVTIALTCTRHGSFPNGWRPKFLDYARAMQWAARQRRS